MDHLTPEYLASALTFLIVQKDNGFCALLSDEIWDALPTCARSTDTKGQRMIESPLAIHRLGLSPDTSKIPVQTTSLAACRQHYQTVMADYRTAPVGMSPQAFQPDRDVN